MIKVVYQKVLNSKHEKWPVKFNSKFNNSFQYLRCSDFYTLNMNCLLIHSEMLTILWIIMMSRHADPHKNKHERYKYPLHVIGEEALFNRMLSCSLTTSWHAFFALIKNKEPNSRWDLSSVARKLRHPLQPKNGLMHYSQKVNETHTHWQEVDTTHALQPESQWDSGTLASCTGAWVRVKTCAPVSNDTGFIHH